MNEQLRNLRATSLRSLRVLAWGLLAASSAMAQLDPRLQSSNTDFLDLYQQSSSLRPKPEIVSVFDFSRSMASLMYHPLYPNNDLNDADDYRYMRFNLNGASLGTPPNNRYQLYARSGNDINAYVSAILTISPDGTGAIAPEYNPASCRDYYGGNGLCTAAPTMTFQAYAWGNGAAWATAVFSPIAGSSNYTATTTNNGTQGSPSYTVSMALSPSSGPYAPNSLVTLTATLTHAFAEGEDLSHKNFSWGYTTPSAINSGPVWSEVSSGVYQSVMTIRTPNYPQDKTQLAPMEARIGGSGAWSASLSNIPAGSTVNLRSYFLAQGTGSWNNLIQWVQLIAYSTSNVCALPTPNPVNSTATTNPEAGGNTTVSLVLPAYCTNPPTGATDPSVTASLDVSVGSSFNSATGYATSVGFTYPGTLNGTLRKPDGTAVTMVDAAAASGSLVGTSSGVLDVRNWLRAASHVRFAKGNRTIDLPIPWKVMDRGSSGVPLSSKTLLDRQIKTVAGVSTTYGSGQQVELDTCYTIGSGQNAVFTYDTNGSSAYSLSMVYLYTVLYRPAYIAWLFNGKYQSSDATKANYTTEGSLVGKYVAFDASNASLVGGQGNASWGQGFGPSGSWGTMSIPKYSQDGSYLGTALEDASSYRTPALTRLQATKWAAIQTWIAHQADVYWAFRCLDPTNEANSGAATSINNSSSTTLNASSPANTHVDGLDSGWTVLNNTTGQGINALSGNSVTGMTRIAGLFAAGNTPLTYAMARTLAQYADPSSVFNAVAGGDVSQCGNPFLLLFTDGLDNNGTLTTNTNATTPYITGSGDAAALDVRVGNRAVLASPTSINRNGSYWNLFTMAGVAAHLADPTLGTLNVDYKAAPDTPPSGSLSPSAFLPFAIKKRNGVTYSRDHRVTTMTVGVSLAGHYTQDASPKRSLFLAAALGDAGISSGTLSSFHSFNGWEQPANATLDPSNDWIPDPTDPGSYPAVGMRRPGAVYFFDATDKDKLATSLDFAFRIAIGTGGNQATSSPNIPFVGASLGSQFYLGRFTPPSSGGVLWPGDLLMFGLSQANGSISVLDRNGSPTTTLDATTAHWSASTALASGPVGTARRLYTRTPGDSALRRFRATGPAFTDASTGLKNFVATSVGDDATKQLVIHHAAGGDITNLVGGVPASNRSNIMGDVINSAPAALEYSLSAVQGGLSDFNSLVAVSGSRRFRLILVGTNQGWLHAFGEVTRLSSGGAVTQAAVQELWSFMPTDFLANLDTLTVSSNPHRSMVDGSPAIYHLDLPLSNGGPGNGVVDAGERAMVIIGLGKGGRSYYALDIHDPFNPTLAWSWVPDEAATFSSDRIATGGPVLATVQGILQKAGFATSTPAIGRVLDGAGVLRDAVFLGGGFSVPEVEANFRDASNQPMLLGRSATALDVSSGKVLAALDLSTDAAVSNPLAVGPVAAGVVPFEFVLNSGMAQRAYFTDYRGGLWVWGSKAVSSAAPYTNFRRDTSQIQTWTLRKVYQDDNANYGARYTTLPAPFRVGIFPGVGQAGATAPAAVGVALISGDRNNPLDRSYSNLSSPPNPAPTRHRVTVVFDRQDSRAWGLDTANGADTGITTTQLKNFTGNTVTDDNAQTGCESPMFKYITQGCASYYLAPYQYNGSGRITPLTPTFGYYISLPAGANGFVPKGINPPLVVAGSLFYSQFTPTASDPCTGGAGTTTTYAIYDVLNPIVTDTRLDVASKSGAYAAWVGVASNLLSIGGRGVLQGGMVASTNAQGGITSTMTLAATSVAATERYPKARAWRIVH